MVIFSPTNCLFVFEKLTNAYQRSLLPPPPLFPVLATLTNAKTPHIHALMLAYMTLTYAYIHFIYSFLFN